MTDNNLQKMIKDISEHFKHIAFANAFPKLYKIFIKNVEQLEIKEIESELSLAVQHFSFVSNDKIEEAMKALNKEFGKYRAQAREEKMGRSRMNKKCYNKFKNHKVIGNIKNPITKRKAVINRKTVKSLSPIVRNKCGGRK